MGTRWRRSLLGTQAIYEVVVVSEETILVTVVEAPGLSPGAQLRLHPDAFATMQRVDAD